MSSASTSKPILITVDVGNNPARCRFLVYHKGLEDKVEMRTPGDYGGLSSDAYRAINPQGKIPALVLPGGKTLFEAKVVFQYLNDVYGEVGPTVSPGSTPEDRALVALLVQTHDLYIASPNSSDPRVTANQGAMYKSVELIDAESRVGKLAELNKQLDVLESLIVGPFAAGNALSEADMTLWPTLGVFFTFMLPRVFGWAHPLQHEARPKLKAWFAAVGALPAAKKVQDEILASLRGWEDSGKFVPIQQQMEANPSLKWKYPWTP